MNACSDARVWLAQTPGESLIGKQMLRSETV